MSFQDVPMSKCRRIEVYFALIGGSVSCRKCFEFTPVIGGASGASWADDFRAGRAVVDASFMHRHLVTCHNDSGLARFFTF